MSDEIQFVYCPECGEQAPDFGCSVKCEYCGFAPMPYYDEDGELVTEDSRATATKSSAPVTPAAVEMFFNPDGDGDPRED